MRSIKEKIISQLNLVPHPEGGFYREIYRSDHRFQDQRANGHFEERNLETKMPGTDVTRGHEPQVIIPAGTVFGAGLSDKSSYALCGCRVAPGFDFRDFTLPEKEHLLSRFPEHAEIIMKLVKDR